MAIYQPQPPPHLPPHPPQPGPPQPGPPQPPPHPRPKRGLGSGLAFGTGVAKIKEEKNNNFIVYWLMYLFMSMIRVRRKDEIYT